MKKEIKSSEELNSVIEPYATDSDTESKLFQLACNRYRRYCDIHAYSFQMPSQHSTELFSGKRGSKDVIIIKLANAYGELYRTAVSYQKVECLERGLALKGGLR